LSGFTYLPRDCPRCGHSISVEETSCPHCGDERDVGFRFPILHALGIALFVAGAITYHFYPDVGATLMWLGGYGDAIPQQ
jgi:hypothetical protein